MNIDSILSKKILVVGDVMLDVYFSGEVTRISPEAPVPIFKKTGQRCALGGAANVAANLVAANQETLVLSMVGDDAEGALIKDLFAEIGVDASQVKTWEKNTITKTRFLAENNQQVMRLDIENDQLISKEEEYSLITIFGELVGKFDVVLISDYMKGLLTYDLTQRLISIADAHGKKVLVDVKDPCFEKYKGAWLLKPNKKELGIITQMPVTDDEEIVEAANFLREQAECEYVLTTCGAKGMILVGNDIVYHLDTVGKSVYDVAGAGDTTIAYLAAALASGLEIKEAMKIANHAAGIQVGKVGTSTVYLHEVEESIKAINGSGKQKIFRINERMQLKALITEWRNKNLTIATTNGCFDIIHRGHISLLEQAKQFADKLIVMVNSDASVKRLKGTNRPINSEEDRAMIIAALDCVDAVVLFDPLVDNKLIPGEELDGLSDDLRKIAVEAPMGILRLISPDVHVKGGDYTVDQVPEAMYAGSFRAVPFVKGYSTTQTIRKSSM